MAQDVVDTAFPNQGALCVAGTRFLVQESIHDEIMPLIVEKARAIRAGDPLKPDTTFGALVNEAHMNKVLGYIESGKQEGAELLLGGERVFPKGDPSLESGFYIEPTIFDHVEPTAKIAQEEIFGPVLSVISFKDEEEAIRIANNTCYGLAAIAATTNLGRAQRLGEHISSGQLIIVGNTEFSGGGINLSYDKHGQSGIGFSSGVRGLEEYTVSTVVTLLS